MKTSIQSLIDDARCQHVALTWHDSEKVNNI